MSIKLRITLVLTMTFISHGLFPQSVETIVQTGHYAAVTAVCYSPDGRFIATGSDDKTVKLWRRTDGREIRTFQGNISGISSVEINRQGTDILSVSNNGTLTVWEISSGKIVNQIRQAEDRFTCASFHPDGTKVIAGTRKSFISLWDIVTGTKMSDIKAIPADLNYQKGFDYPEAKAWLTASMENISLQGWLTIQPYYGMLQQGKR